MVKRDAMIVMMSGASKMKRVCMCHYINKVKMAVSIIPPPIKK